MKFAKFISENCAAGAPDMKNGKPYTEEMAKADGFLPIVTNPIPEDLIRPKAQYKIENDTIIEYYVEDEEPLPSEFFEMSPENMPPDNELPHMTQEELEKLGLTFN